MSKKLVLIDGNSIINRAFFAIPDLTNAQGIHTNAVYGFLNILFRILNEENADCLVVAFDVHEPTFRHKMYSEYKGTRKGMPDELRQQVPILKELLAAMGIKTMEKGGLEADDILGTLAKRGEKEGYEVTLVSGDRDLLQIATDNILIRIPKTKGGKTEIENYHTKDVIERYGLEPLQIIELKGLMGDSSDNIPGVPKIGEKTATELLKQYHDIDNLKLHIEEITKKSVRETLTENFDMAILSRKLATIEINADIELDFEDAKLGNIYTNEAYLMVKELGFKNMLSRFDEAATAVDDSFRDTFTTVDDLAAVESFMDEIRSSGRIAFVISDVGLAVTASKEKTVFIPAAGMHPIDYLADRLTSSILDGNTDIVTFDLKSQLGLLPKLSDCAFAEEHVTDVCVGAYICNPLKNDHSIEDVANEYCGLVIKSASELFGKNTPAESFMMFPDTVMEYYCTYSYVCFASFDKVTAKIEEFGMTKLFKEIEMPLIPCLYDMERLGIRLIPSQLHYHIYLLSVLTLLPGSAVHLCAFYSYLIKSVVFDVFPPMIGHLIKIGIMIIFNIPARIIGSVPAVKNDYNIRPGIFVNIIIQIELLLTVGCGSPGCRVSARQSGCCISPGKDLREQNISVRIAAYDLKLPCIHTVIAYHFIHIIVLLQMFFGSIKAFRNTIRDP